MSERTFFNTRAAQIAMQSLDRIRKEEIIGMVVARPGIGKTQSNKRWLAKQGANFRYVWIEADVLTSPRPILTALVRALGLAETAGDASRMYSMKQRVAEALAKDPVFVGIDEADLLTVRTFDFLRSIWDRVSDLRDTDGERGFPLALLGTPKLRDMLGRDDLERLRRRTFHKAELPALNLKETDLIVKTKWQVPFDDDGIAALHRLSHGSFGWLNVIVPIAAKLASKDGGVMTAKVVRSSEKYLVGLPED
jgi:type II secretory pathway predicted ATPase ExeA